ncbi:MAG: hypothetical protein L6R41_005638 [Letrouitia leprolyta]|nr:MAG: hypothetical protein L6R41_005638 [Letrouitia leprolyta]
MSAEQLVKMSLAPSKDSQLTDFPFLRLPSDIRRYSYKMVLPGPKTFAKAGGWVEFCSSPNKFLALLRVNKQISDEALQVLYSSTCSTATITEDVLAFREIYDDSRLFLPFRPKGTLRCMRDWQLALRFRPEYNADPIPCSRLAPHHDSRLTIQQYYIREGVFSTAVILNRISELQTLKISFPCLCKKKQDTTVDRVREAIAFANKPLQQVRFHTSVTFIAAAAITEPSGPRERVKLQSTSAANTQCQQPACISFIQSLDAIKTKFQDDTSRTTLTARQTEWMELKLVAAAMTPDDPQVLFALACVWFALDHKTDEEFKGALDGANWTINSTFMNKWMHGRNRR